eukprot:COSAG06_NODE_10251_length_1719_cov_1.203704_2_plen_228_part_01
MLMMHQSPQPKVGSFAAPPRKAPPHCLAPHMPGSGPCCAGAPRHYVRLGRDDEVVAPFPVLVVRGDIIFPAKIVMPRGHDDDDRRGCYFSAIDAEKNRKEGNYLVEKDYTTHVVREWVHGDNIFVGQATGHASSDEAARKTRSSSTTTTAAWSIAAIIDDNRCLEVTWTCSQPQTSVWLYFAGKSAKPTDKPLPRAASKIWQKAMGSTAGTVVFDQGSTRVRPGLSQV